MVMDRVRGKTSFDNALLKGIVGGADFTVGTEATNAITVNVQLNDGAGAEIDFAAQVFWWLSTDTAGQTTASAPDGGTAAGTDGTLHEFTAQIAGMAISESDGDIDFVLTESSTGTWYLNIGLSNGKIATSGAITFA